MRKQGKPRISQCMIVKNEENNIEKALSWGKGIVSEQIVVDTGSMDRTVEIAEQMGAKVYHFQWIDDFAAAKNFAISKARYEWIALLDADEYVTPEDGKKLLNYVVELHPTTCVSLMTGWIHLNDDGGVISASAQIRVFRNMPALRYQRRIHEHLQMSDGSLIQVADVVKDVSIYHTGYQTEASRKKVGVGRNFKLIQAELAEHPDDYEMHGYLGNEYEAMSQWKEAKESYEKAVSLMPEKMKGKYDMTTSGIYHRLLELRAALPDTREEELVELYHRAVERWPEDGDFDYDMGRYYVLRGNYQLGEKHIKQALNVMEHYGNSLKSSLLSGRLAEAYESLAKCYYNNGKLDECVKLATVLLKEDAYRMASLALMLSSFKKKMDEAELGEAGAVEVAKFLGTSFYDFQGLKDRLFVLRAAKETGYQELETIIKGMFTSEELAIVEQALNR